MSPNVFAVLSLALKVPNYFEFSGENLSNTGQTCLALLTFPGDLLTNEE